MAKPISVPGGEGEWQCSIRVFTDRDPGFEKELAWSISKDRRFTPPINASVVGIDEPDEGKIVPLPQIGDERLQRHEGSENLQWLEDEQSLSCHCGTIHRANIGKCSNCGSKNSFAWLADHHQLLDQWVDIQLSQHFWNQIPFKLIQNGDEYASALAGCVESPFPERGEQEEMNDFMQRIQEYFRYVFLASNPSWLAQHLAPGLEHDAKVCAAQVQDLPAIIAGTIMERDLPSARATNPALLREIREEIAPHARNVASGLKQNAATYRALLAAFGPANKVFSKDHSFKLGKFLFDAARAFVNPVGGAIRVGLAIFKDKREQNCMEALDNALNTHMNTLTRYWDSYNEVRGQLLGQLEKHSQEIKTGVVVKLLDTYQSSGLVEREHLAGLMRGRLQKLALANAWKPLLTYGAVAAMIFAVLFAVDHGIRAKWFPESRKITEQVAPARVELTREPAGQVAQVAQMSSRKASRIAVYKSDQGRSRQLNRRGKRYRLSPDSNYEIVAEAEQKKRLQIKLDDEGTTGWVRKQDISTTTVYRQVKKQIPAKTREVTQTALAFEKVTFQETFTSLTPLWLLIVGLLYSVLIGISAGSVLGVGPGIFVSGFNVALIWLLVAFLRMATINWIVS